MSNNVRVYDIAKEFDISNRELLAILTRQGIDVKSHMSTVDEHLIPKIRGMLEKRKTNAAPTQQQEEGTPDTKTDQQSTAYIPPRRRQKKRHEGAERVIPSRPPIGQQQKPASFRKANPKMSSSEQQPPTSQTGEQMAATSQAPGAKTQERTTPAPRKAQFVQRREGQGKERGKASQKVYIARRKKESPPQPSKDASSVSKKDETQDTKSDPRKQHKQGDRRPTKSRETPAKKKTGEAATPPARRNEQPKQEEQDAVKKKSSAFQRQKVLTTQPPHRSRKPYRKPGTKSSAGKSSAKKIVPQVKVEEAPKQLEIPEVIMVKELADKMRVPPAKLIRHLMTMGIMANVNQVLDTKAAMSIAEFFEFEVKAVTADEEVKLKMNVVDESKLRPRAPVVTIMGHVDHGKTTLLDAIRESKITDSEFGGITQHIGAYSVDINGQRIVFLDTPGHEAFTAMRARGAKATDAVVLVVAADDGIMPQTIEAIDHARAAEVPIIVAINKIDLPGANPDRVMQELTKYGLTPEEWGGDAICVKVSAKQRINLDGVLEMILLQSEMLELKADPDCPAQGVIVEALLDKGRGPVATVLIQNGTLRVGDPFVVGQHYGKVRAMFDDKGKRVEESGPATPVEVLGLTNVPVAGDVFVVVESDRRARQISSIRQEQQQKTELTKNAKITLEELHNHIKDGETQELRIIIKADVHGSVEALSDSLERLSTEKVRLQVIHGGVGAINESDVMLADASNAIILGFNIRPVAKAQEMADKEKIDVRLYTVIYQAIDDVKKAMEGLLKPVFKEVLSGQAQVQAIFSLPKLGAVAGCRVTEGKMTRNAIARLLRDNQEVFKGNIASLRRVKDDVKEVMSGYECGIRLENYTDVREGDIIEAYILEKVTMTLDGKVK